MFACHNLDIYIWLPLLCKAHTFLYLHLHTILESSPVKTICCSKKPSNTYKCRPVPSMIHAVEDLIQDVEQYFLWIRISPCFWSTSYITVILTSVTTKLHADGTFSWNGIELNAKNHRFVFCFSKSFKLLLKAGNIGRLLSQRGLDKVQANHISFLYRMRKP